MAKDGIHDQWHLTRLNLLFVPTRFLTSFPTASEGEGEDERAMSVIVMITAALVAAVLHVEASVPV
jgi:hypothetical protein